jgi:membrane carboxypeptidase/penicillin-binding protein
MQQVVQNGTGRAALALGRPAAGKTGTATNDKDAVSSAWFTGYTPQLATSVMYVRGDGDDQLDGWLPSYFGADYPAETWTAIMQRDMEGLPVEEFPPPAYVDGDAPDVGHEPYTPPPATTRAPSPTRTTKSP